MDKYNEERKASYENAAQSGNSFEERIRKFEKKHSSISTNGIEKAKEANSYIFYSLDTDRSSKSSEPATIKLKAKISSRATFVPSTERTSVSPTKATEFKSTPFALRNVPGTVSQYRESKKTLVNKSASKMGEYGTRVTKKRNNCAYVGLNGWPVDGNGTLMTVIDNYNLSCVPQRSTVETCRKPFYYFKRYYPETKARECADHSTSTTPICTFDTKYRRSPEDRVVAKCNSDVCAGSAIRVGCSNREYGTIEDLPQWKVFEDTTELEEKLPRIVIESSRYHFDFCFVRCDPNGHKRILQSLIFPPVIKTKIGTPTKPININILVEDAVSRPHFYRLLPRTVFALRTIAENSSGLSQATVIDFEMVQSFVSYTLGNIQHLFAGRKYEKSNKATVRKSGMETMLPHLKTFGYQTLIHEDLCWFDYWGGIVSPAFNTHKIGYFTKEFKEAFQNYTKRTAQYVDNRGLSYMSCEVLRIYGLTNPFNGRKLPTFCLDGKFISEYFLNYIINFVNVLESDETLAPGFLYTHLNTGHESTGKRIRTDDVILSKFVEKSSQNENTITIILSDHGGKTTNYATNTLEGNLEIFSPVLFMIIPQKVASKLGEKRMEVLKLNQKRLVTLLDLHRTLLSVVNLSEKQNQDHEVGGLFAPIPASRTCSDISGLSTEALCRCQGWNMFLSEKDTTVLWLAEYALGEINSMIQKQYMEARQNSTNKNLFGYGACARFIGKKVARPRRKLDGEFFLTTMVLVVVPAWGKKSEERFEVVLRHSVTQKDNVEFQKFTRLSFYSTYEPCADKGVDLELCACANKKSKRRMPHDIISIINRPSFRLRPTVQELDSKCLVVIWRRKKAFVPGKELETRILTIEVVNQCNDRTFVLKVAGSYRKAVFSKSIPLTVIIRPRTINFIVTVYLNWKFGRYKPAITHSLLGEQTVELR